MGGLLCVLEQLNLLTVQDSTLSSVLSILTFSSLVSFPSHYSHTRTDAHPIKRKLPKWPLFTNGGDASSSFAPRVGNRTYWSPRCSDLVMANEQLLKNGKKE